VIRPALNAQYTPPTLRNCLVASRRRWRCVHEFATSSRRLPTDSIDNLKTGQTDSIAVWLTWNLIDTDNFFNSDDTMTSLLKKVINIQNWCNQTLWSLFGQFQNCRPNPSAVVANCVHTADADATKQFRRVGVGGVYWALCCTIRTTEGGYLLIHYTITACKINVKL